MRKVTRKRRIRSTNFKSCCEKREAIREKDKEHYKNNKEEINQKRREIAADLKITDPEIAEKKLKYLQAYRELNLAKIKKQKTTKIQCLACKAVLTRQCWKTHTSSLSHINKMKDNPEILNQDNFVVLKAEVLGKMVDGE